MNPYLYREEHDVMSEYCIQLLLTIHKHIHNIYQIYLYIYSRFSLNSVAFASEFNENLKKMIPGKYVY